MEDVDVALLYLTYYVNNVSVEAVCDRMVSDRAEEPFEILSQNHYSDITFLKHIKIVLL